MQIMTEKIQPNPEQPRKTFRKETLKELGESIKRHGIVQPIVVEREGDVYVLVAGERRWRACQLIGKKALELGREVIVQDRANHNGRERMLSAVIENVQREDMNVIEEGMAYRTLIDEHGMRPSEIAAKIGKSVSHIMNCLERLQLPKEIQEMMREGQVSADMRLVQAFRSLPERKAAIALAQRASERNMMIKGIVLAAQRLKEAIEAEPLIRKGTPALRLASRGRCGRRPGA